MNLQNMIGWAEGYAAKLPEHVRLYVGRDGPLTWVRAWRWGPAIEERTPQRHIGDKVLVFNRGNVAWAPTERDLASACEEAVRELMERADG